MEAFLLCIRTLLRGLEQRHSICRTHLAPRQQEGMSEGLGGIFCHCPEREGCTAETGEHNPH